MKRYVIGLIAILSFVGCKSNSPKTNAGNDWESNKSTSENMFPKYNEAGFLKWKDIRAPASESEQEKCAKLVERVKQAGCYISKNDAERIEKNGDICRHIESSSGKTEMEIVLLEKSDKVVTIATHGAQRDGNWCPSVKYEVDPSGIEDFKVIKNKAFMLSKDGQVYFMYTDGSFYELLNSDKEQYKSVKAIKGSVRGDGIELQFKHGGKPFKIDDDKFADKISQGQARRLKININPSNESLFRDR